MSCSTPSSTIRYTTDGSTPTRTIGTIYSSALTFTSTTNLKAVCYAPSYSTSSVASKTFTMDLKADPVTFSKASNTYTDNISVYLSTTTPSPYEIRYTFDGSTPTSSSTLYTNSLILITKNTTLKAVVFKSGYQQSDVSTATYTFKLDPPSFSPAPGNYSDSVTPQINSVAGASIRYTLDGSQPTQSHGTLINNGGSTIPITSTSRLRAIAYKTGWSSSNEQSGYYSINSPAATPTFSPSGPFNGSGIIYISCTTSSSTIRYGLGSTIPTKTTGTIYSGGITITSTTTINAICYASGYSTSAVATQTFTINIIPDPVTVAGGGTFCDSATLTASGGAGGDIYYQGTTSNGTSTANQTNTQVVTSTGTYYFRSKSSADVWGPQGSATVTINPNPTTPTLISGNTNIFDGQSTTLTASGGTGTGYQWYANGCASGSVLSISNSLTTSPSSNTTYYVRSTSSCGVSSCISKAVTVTSKPTPATCYANGLQIVCPANYTTTCQYISGQWICPPV